MTKGEGTKAAEGREGRERGEVRNVSWARNLEGRYCVHWRGVWVISSRVVVMIEMQGDSRGLFGWVD